ncbi:sulfatase-like hydrolase/transferase [bacterium]|nr:sulfatase-like hydrolase/transferase [bacterium]
MNVPTNPSRESRRAFLKMMASSTLGLMLYRCTGTENHPPPNILLILVDDLGYGDLSSFGGGDLRTPHIDSLVNEGMKFINFYANCPVCSPTRASILTGRYPELVGVPGVIRTHPNNSWGNLIDDAFLLPEILKQADYHSALIGKWHLGLESPDLPNERGFHFFKGFLGDMMDDYYTHMRHGINYMRENIDEIHPMGHATELFTEWACDYLEGRQEMANPFFLYIAYNAPHAPVQPPEEWVQQYREWEWLSNNTRANLCAFIEHLDYHIGIVLKKLAETGLDRNTVVIFTSDNGGLLADCAHNGPYRSGKQLLYEGGLRVPMAVKWPGKIRPGSVSDHVLLTMDLFPTITEIAGIPITHEIDGLGFLDTLLGKRQAHLMRDIFFGRKEGSYHGIRYEGGGTIYAIRRGEWKLLEPYPGGPMELYNLETDPMERDNLADREKDIYHVLSEALTNQIKKYNEIPWQ